MYHLKQCGDSMLSKRELKAIHGCFLFRDVDEFIVEQMAEDQRCSLKEYKKDEIIYSRDKYERSLGILLSGRVQVDKPNSSLLISTLKAGDTFGAAAMFHENEEYVNELTALSDVRVLFIPQELLEWIMRRDYQIAKNYISYLSERIIFLNRKMEALSAGSAEKKLARYLLQQQEICCSMTELSARVNMGRATLYRVLGQLEASGAIHKSGKCITVMDPQILIRILEETT